jgi:hypothetical protein
VSVEAERPSNEDKAAWCELGARAEEDFAGPAFNSRCAVFMNPAKIENKYSHDVFAVMPADLKTVRTRFETADRYGVNPRSAITLNLKDVQRYSELYPNILIIFDVDFGDYKRKCYISLHELKRGIAGGKFKIHRYLHRDGGDGNATESYVIDAEKFYRFD